MPRRAIKMIAVLAAAALCVAPATAAAKKKKTKTVQVITATATSGVLHDNDLANVTATCPPKTKAISGGFRSNPAVGASVFYTTSSLRSSDTTWQVMGLVNTNGPLPTMSLTVEAYCAKLPGSVTSGQGSGTILSNTTGGAQASCPGSTRLLSGGFAVDPGLVGTETFVLGNHRAASNTWGIEAFSNSSQKSATAYAYCFKKKKGKKKQKKGPPAPKALTEVSAPGSLQPASQTFTTVSTPACPKGRKTLSGGFTAPPIVNFASPVPSFYESALVGGVWKVSAEQLTSNAGSFTALAYCG